MRSPKFKTSSGFVLPIHSDVPRTPLRQWPALGGIAACLLAAGITLNPTLGDSWSQVSYPAVAAADRILVRLGVSIGPQEPSSEVTARPVIAIVLGCIQPDDSVEEVDRWAGLSDQPEVGNLRDVVRPAHWRRTSQTQDPPSEADEIRN